MHVTAFTRKEEKCLFIWNQVQKKITQFLGSNQSTAEGHMCNRLERRKNIYMVRKRRHGVSTKPSPVCSPCVTPSLLSPHSLPLSVKLRVLYHSCSIPAFSKTAVHFQNPSVTTSLSVLLVSCLFSVGDGSISADEVCN